jgi:hypothetical protein
MSASRNKGLNPQFMSNTFGGFRKKSKLRERAHYAVRRSHIFPSSFFHTSAAAMLNYIKYMFGKNFLKD